MCLAIRDRKIKRVCIDHAPSLATQIFLPGRFPKRRRPGFLVLGDMPQAKADGSEIRGPRLPVPQRRATGRKAGPGRFPEWLVDGSRFEFLPRRIASIETTQYIFENVNARLIRSLGVAGTEIAGALQIAAASLDRIGIKVRALRLMHFHQWNLLAAKRPHMRNRAGRKRVWP